MLIDATRGVCEQDEKVLRLLRKRGVPFLPVMTKTDLLQPELLACAHTVTRVPPSALTLSPAALGPQRSATRPQRSATRPQRSASRPQR